MTNMKDSGIEWIGKIPENWNLMRTGHVAQYHKDIVGEREADFQRLALTMNGVVQRSKVDANGLQPDNFNTYQILKEGDIVFKLIDLANIATSRVGYSPYTGIVSPAYIIITPTNINGNFLEYFFLSMYHNHVFNMLGSAGVRSSLNKEDVMKLPVPVPPLETQRRIADYLDGKTAILDEKIAAAKSQIENLKAYRAALIHDVVCHGVPGSHDNACYVNSGISWIGNIPKGWKIKRGFNIFDRVKALNSNMQNNNLLSLSYGKIKKKSIDSAKGLLPESFTTYNIIQHNDIVFRMTDLQNDHKSLRTGICKESAGIITSAYITVRVKEEYSADYFHYLFHAADIMKVFYNIGDGVRQNVTYDILAKLLFIAPSLTEQQQIVQYLDAKTTSIDNTIVNIAKLIEDLEQYKRALIYEVITGKKEI